MATENVSGIREETARELERIRREVLMAKQELRDRFEYYSHVLRDKHLEMEARLDEVVRVAETQVADRQTKLNQLIITKAEVSQNLIHNELNETRVNVSRELDEKIQGLEANADQVPSVWLEWRDEWLESGMTELCHVCEGVSYANRHNPVWSGVYAGEEQTELSMPYALATDRHNGDVYVSDYNGFKIHVFSREGIRYKIIALQGLFYIDAISVTPHQLFVKGSGPNRIYKLDKMSGNFMCSVELDFLIFGLTADATTLYSGMCESNQISHFSLEDLTTIRVTPLNSPHITQDTILQDLKIATSIFVVLFWHSNYPIQTFSLEGNLIQTIASRNQLIEAYYLCVDRHFNIIVSDAKADNLKVFSIEGHLLTTIGQRGDGPGEFRRPKGIDIDKEGRIVVVSFKRSHILQFF